MSSLFPRDWDWMQDTCVCGVVIENRCVAGKVSYRAQKDGKMLFGGGENFGFQEILFALYAEGYIA